LKSLPPIDTTTCLTLCVVANCCSSLAWPSRPAPLSKKSRPGLKLSPFEVVVRAPEQARFSPPTPPPM
jgi:hypothetical protein